MRAKLLIVDDETSIRDFFEILLQREGYEVHLASGGEEAIARVKNEAFDLLITDLSMPDISGMDVLKQVKTISPETTVLMITAYGSAETAVEAMKLGAYDYLMKPFKVDEVRLVIKNALEKSQLSRENEILKKEIGRKRGFEHFIGKSAKMKKVFELIERVASGRASVLISGESGTGKELTAKAIHENSPRASSPFISVNCGAIPETLIESELFGYMRGAFTGANSNRMGLFEAANQGTFFLDEVGELPLQVQVKLLRVIQEKSVRRLGSTASKPIDVRIISATNVDLEEAIQRGTFREDLFYRLNVIRVHMPSLRERSEDIPLLAQYFLEKFSKEHGKEILGFDREAMQKLMRHSFPGNVRELENIIEQCVAMEKGSMVQAETIPLDSSVHLPKGQALDFHLPEAGVNLEQILEMQERQYLQAALDRSGGLKKRAAELLGLSFRSFRYRLSKLGMAGADESEEDLQS